MNSKKVNKNIQKNRQSSLSKEIQYGKYLSPLGLLWIGLYQNELCLISKDISNIKKLNRFFSEFEEIEKLPLKLKKELDQYFSGKSKEFNYPLHFFSGTEFEQKVWKALQTIPYGETRSYAWLAKKIGNPQAVRAVGGANGKNQIPIVIPCHRVINSNGKLGGYSGGLSFKKKLLELEGITL